MTALPSMRQLAATLFTCLLLIASGCSTVISATSDGPIVEDYSERTWGSFVDDQAIETKAYVNIKKTDEALSKNPIKITSYNGSVLIVGQIPTEAGKQLIGSVVEKIRKVRRVHNELTVSAPTTALVGTSDAWITSKIKSRLLFTKGIRSGQIKVITENGTVFLLGLVTRDQANRVVAAVQQTGGIQKIVKVFEYIDDGTTY